MTSAASDAIARVSRRALLVGAGSLLTASALRPAFALASGLAGGRIVVAGGSAAEILVTLGQQARIVAVDTTSTFPSSLRTLPNVGYLRALSAEGVLSLRPSSVIALDGAGPPDALRLIEAAGSPVIRIPDQPTPDGVIAKIRRIAEVVDATEQGERLAAQVAQDFATLASDLDSAAPVRAMFVLSLQNGRAMVAGLGTAADGILQLAGATNAARDHLGYKPLSDEAIIAAAPDVIVMMDRAGATPDPAVVFGENALARTPAGRDRRLVVREGQYLLGFGPRAPRAARDLALALRTSAARP